MYERKENSESVEGRFANPASSFAAVCFDWLESLVQAAVLVSVLFVFFYRGVNVDGESMLDTLHDGDKLVVRKFNYKPQNNDIVIVSPVNQLDKPIVKRVIATEGQTLSIDFSKNEVIVDGKKLNENYIYEPMIATGDGDIPSVIPAGHTFVMGDNRNNSLDSRYKAVGVVPNDKIVGKAVYRFFPFDRIGVI